LPDLKCLSTLVSGRICLAQKITNERDFAPWNGWD
jgi:hypothetical protein